MVPVLLALHPEAARRLPRMLTLLARGTLQGLFDQAAPRFGHDIAGGGRPTAPADALADAVRATLPPEDAAALLDALVTGGGMGTDISSAKAGPRADVVARTLRALVREDRTFDTTAEKGEEYRRAATRAISRGFRGVVFGHTHLAVREEIDAPGGSGVYVNTGTWADLMRLPAGLLAPDLDEAARACEAFLEAVGRGELEPLLLRRPTYARIQLDEGRARSIGLYEYRDEAPDSPSNLIAE